MKLTINTTPTLYDAATAHAKAAELQSSDPDWKYTVVEFGNGLARIDMYDETGEFVASWKEH